jgi:hypothetical protein
MSNTLKVVLIVTAAVVVTCVGGGVYLYQRYGKELVAQGQAAMKEGEAFAQRTDQDGCVAEARIRVGQDTSVRAARSEGKAARGVAAMSLMISQTFFLQSCLSRSTPTAGFCDDVPSTRDRERSQLWMKEQCGDSAATGVGCGIVAGSVQGFCHERKPG